MNRIILIPLAVLAASCTAPPPEMTAAQREDLSQVLAGRTALPPLSCISRTRLGGNRGYGEEAILFGYPNDRTVYVNQPPGGCPKLTRFRALRTSSPSLQLCSGDIVTVFDPSSGIEYGGCGLGEFTPYRR